MHTNQHTDTAPAMSCLDCYWQGSCAEHRRIFEEEDIYVCDYLAPDLDADDLQDVDGVTYTVEGAYDLMLTYELELYWNRRLADADETI